MRDARRVDQFKDHRERNGGYAQQDQGALAIEAQGRAAPLRSVEVPCRSWLIVNSDRELRPSALSGVPGLPSVREVQT